MVDFKDHGRVLRLLTEAQDADRDNRDRAREAAEFVDLPDGQWEPDVITAFDGKPRYTFDQTSPIVDLIAGAMEQSSFDIKIRPAGGEATKELAKLRDGLIRNIQVVSNSEDTFNGASRGMVKTGFDAWLVAHDFVDGDSVDQDIIIEPIYNAIDSAWFDPNARRQDKSDGKHGFVLQAFTKEAYEEKYPEGSGTSVDNGRTTSRNHKTSGADDIIVGQIYYLRFENKTLHRLANGAVLNDEQVEELNKRLKAAGVPAVKTKASKRKTPTAFTRKFDGGGWLDDEQETVFAWVPMIPIYGNFSSIDNRDVYRGVVEKLMDAQRVLNYAESRKIENTALAPRPKWWMTIAQAMGFESTLATMNTNTDPVQFYNVDPLAPGTPQQTGSAIVDPGLQGITLGMLDMFGRTTGMFPASMGDNPGLQSGVAIKSLQNKGDIGTIKYFKSREIAMCHTGRIIDDALNRVYDTRRQQRILGEDGSFGIEEINRPVFDQDQQDTVIINDLSQGKYDVTCKAGPTFDNQMDESVSAFVEVAKVLPDVMQLGADVFLKSISAKGFEPVAERARAKMIETGVIPQDQWTPEEQEKAQQAQLAAQQQPQQPDPVMVIAEAELITAKNLETRTQVDVQKKQADIQIASRKLDQVDKKMLMDARNNQVSADQSQQEIDIKALSAQLKASVEQQELAMAQNMQLFEIVKKQAEAWKFIQEATPEAVTGPGNVNALIGQAEDVVAAQGAVGVTPSVQIP